MKLTVYGSELCHDCRDAFARMKEEGTVYEYVDINASMSNLKAFLRLRDRREEFDAIKADGYVGVPCFYFEDGSLCFDTEEALHRAR